MKDVPIKFRGIEDIKDGKYVYGDYVTRQDGCAIRVKTSANLFNLHEYEVAVKPETVAQLVGYDVEGNEVYEGDELLDANNIDTKNTAHCHVITAKLYVNVNLKCFRLKKVNNNE